MTIKKELIIMYIILNRKKIEELPQMHRYKKDSIVQIIRSFLNEKKKDFPRGTAIVLILRQGKKE